MPLSHWQDNKQSDKPFILLGDRYKPESRTHTVDLFEFDDTTVITLV